MNKENTLDTGVEDEPKVTNRAAGFRGFVDHSSDIEHMYGRFREHDADISSVKTRISGIESRITSMDAGIRDLRDMNHEFTRRVNTVSRDVSDIKASLDESKTERAELKNLLLAITSTLSVHMTEDISRQERVAKEQLVLAKQVAETQIHRTDQVHKLTRAVIIMTTVLAVATVTLLGLRAILLEEEISLMNLFPFVGLGG